MGDAFRLNPPDAFWALTVPKLNVPLEKLVGTFKQQVCANAAVGKAIPKSTSIITRLILPPS
jgi:uncharacterized protein (DUF1800 family)